MAMTAQYSLIEAVISFLDFCLEVWFLVTFIKLVLKLLKMKAVKNQIEAGVVLLGGSNEESRGDVLT
jgi:uncharacterized membrane protein